MSGSTEQLGKKISGARDLGGVVRAMKALAASSVGQYERAVEALDDYLRTVELGLIACLHGEGQGFGPGPSSHSTHHRSALSSSVQIRGL
jgi:F-type H+-transporting ATPase subunit gamma